MAGARLTIDVATRGLADDLSALALRSKAHWGYDDAFMAAVREELRIAPAAIEEGRTFVARLGGATAGFAVLAGERPTGELDALFVDPPFIGRGVGAALLGHVLETAREAGMTAVELDADPFAEDFYRRQGAVVVGRAPSGSIPGRTLPRMRFELPPTA